MIEVDGRNLTVDQVVQVSRGGERVTLGPSVEKRVRSSWEQLWRLVKRGTPVYGLTTGFGALDARQVPLEDNRAQQRNLLMSHAAGVGEPMSTDAVRAMLLLRINALASGVTGVQPDTLDALVGMLNAKVHPMVPKQGSVSACGDLAPLAHLMLPLIGLGRAEYEEEILCGSEALGRAGIPEPDLKGRDGLALINGTEQATAIATLVVADAQRLLQAAQIAAAMSLEALEALRDSFEKRLAELKGHPGQIKVSAALEYLTQNSELTGLPGNGRLRDALSLRCIPQVLGSVEETLEFIVPVVEREMNSASDNPIFYLEDGSVTSNSGNFHGQSIGQAMDFLYTSISSVAVMSERRIARLVDETLNGGLPAFLIEPSDGSSGLHSGFMVAQYTAASLVAEVRASAGAASIQSVPTGANSEDHVPMASIAARKATAAIRATEVVVAIELLAGAQALDFRGNEMGYGTASAYQQIREAVTFMDQDRVISNDIETVKELLVGEAFALDVEAQADSGA